MTDYDWLELQRTAHEEFSRRLEQVTDWEAPTPDTDWNVRQLVQHVIDEQQWVSALLTGMTTRQAQGLLNPLSDDLKAEWRQHSERATTAWRCGSWPAAGPEGRPGQPFIPLVMTPRMMCRCSTR